MVFFAFFVVLLDWVTLILVFLKKDLFSLHKVDDKVVLAVKTDDVTSSRRDVVQHGCLWEVQG